MFYADFDYRRNVKYFGKDMCLWFMVYGLAHGS